MRRVVLVRPAGPRNVGMVLRACANFAPTELVLVAPLRASMLVHPDFEQMAHGVERAAERVRVVVTLEEALADATYSVGFTARARVKRRRRSWTEARGELARFAADPEELVALVFGNEETGLDGDDCMRCQELVHLPTSSEHTSLNLAMAASVVLAGLFHENPPVTTVAEARGARERGGKALSGAGREYLKQVLRHVFAEKVVYTPAARRDVLSMIERVFGRAPLENRDARALHIVLRTLGHELEPADFGLVTHEKKGRHKDARDGVG